MSNARFSFVFALSLFTQAVCGADSLEFRGYFRDSTGLYVTMRLLSDPPETRWLAVGQSIGGYKFIGIDPGGNIAKFSKDGQEVTVPIHVAKIDDSGPLELRTDKEKSPETAEHAAVLQLFKDLKVDEAMKRALAQQRQILGKRIDGKAGANSAATLLEQELSWENIRNDLVEVYATNYSLSEIVALSNFYHTPEGQSMISKQEQISAATLKLLQRRIISATEKASKQLATDTSH